jgi:hypothetical protein
MDNTYEAAPMRGMVLAMKTAVLAVLSDLPLRSP